MEGDPSPALVTDGRYAGTSAAIVHQLSRRSQENSVLNVFFFDMQAYAQTMQSLIFMNAQRHRETLEREAVKRILARQRIASPPRASGAAGRLLGDGGGSAEEGGAMKSGWNEGSNSDEYSGDGGAAASSHSGAMGSAAGGVMGGPDTASSVRSHVEAASVASGMELGGDGAGYDTSLPRNPGTETVIMGGESQAAGGGAAAAAAGGAVVGAGSGSGGDSTGPVVDTDDADFVPMVQLPDSVTRLMRAKGMDPEAESQRKMVQQELADMHAKGVAVGMGKGAGALRLPPEMLTPRGSAYSHLEQVRSRLYFLEQVLVCSNLRLQLSEMQHGQILWRSLIGTALTRESLHLGLMWMARMARPALLGASAGDSLTSLPGDELSAGTYMSVSPAGKHRRCVPLRFLPSDERANAEQAPAGSVGVKSTSARCSPLATRQLFTPKFTLWIFK